MDLLFDTVYQSQDLPEKLWSISARSRRVSNWAERRADATKVSTAGVAADILLLNDILRRAPAAASDICFKICDNAEGSDNLICVQDSWFELFEQAATYGNKLLHSGRWYSMVVCYHSTKHQLRFCFFTIQGMFVTPVLRLAVQSEYGQLVDALFAFCDLTPYERGVHPLFIDHPQKYILLPFDTGGSTAWWKVASVLSVRIAFRGRRSMVAVINQKDTGQAIQDEEVSSTPRKPLVNDEGFLLDERRRWLDNTLAKTEYLPLGLDEFLTEWKSFVRLAGPHMHFKEGILKMGYCLQEDSDVQKEIFHCTAGQHGIPDVLPIMELKHGLGIFRGLTCSSCPDFASFPGQFKIEVEDRVELISICLDNGQSLLGEDLTMRGWIRCLIDGIVGCFHLFLSGYLHRDISIGNVLCRRVPQSRDKLRDNNHPHLRTERFAFMNNVLDSCSGFLIDSDTAIKWRSSGYAQSANRRFYGTRQFMSRRLLFMWIYGKDPVVHTVFDDLESFAWLALWIAASKDPDGPHSQKYIDFLDSDDFEMLLSHKITTALYFTNDTRWCTADRGKPESAIRTIRPLLKEWFSIIDKYHTESIMANWDEAYVENGEGNGFFDKLQTLGEQVCCEYLEKAVEFLDTLPLDPE
ncbi:uncharacterized protein EV420DRAFT_1639176 [Desarmillaria tabescens]|uniref:Fungal-type protein kinase domain-containing protein n=1 Tax=Armillaria tabescens TaxID=1929756 RepID=A0AA39NCG1_ARMTA|nr:uncharacterized protein EV420DRAFT_1639176 [Desarmillaria tabescens]KAK0463090.1 hypothetical protein EV420DRAFT_1639176 [Desarmillaria tabescens]